MQMLGRSFNFWLRFPVFGQTLLGGAGRIFLERHANIGRCSPPDPLLSASRFDLAHDALVLRKIEDRRLFHNRSNLIHVDLLNFIEEVVFFIFPSQGTIVFLIVVYGCSSSS